MYSIINIVYNMWNEYRMNFILWHSFVYASRLRIDDWNERGDESESNRDKHKIKRVHGCTREEIIIGFMSSLTHLHSIRLHKLAEGISNAWLISYTTFSHFKRRSSVHFWFSKSIANRFSILSYLDAQCFSITYYIN